MLAKEGSVAPTCKYWTGRELRCDIGLLRMLAGREGQKCPENEPRAGQQSPACTSGTCLHSLSREYATRQYELMSISVRPRQQAKCGACGGVGHTRAQRVCPLKHLAQADPGARRQRGRDNEDGSDDFGVQGELSGEEDAYEEGEEELTEQGRGPDQLVNALGVNEFEVSAVEALSKDDTVRDCEEAGARVGSETMVEGLNFPRENNGESVFVSAKEGRALGGGERLRAPLSAEGDQRTGQIAFQVDLPALDLAARVVPLEELPMGVLSSAQWLPALHHLMIGGQSNLQVYTGDGGKLRIENSKRVSGTRDLLPMLQHGGSCSEDPMAHLGLEPAFKLQGPDVRFPASTEEGGRIRLRAVELAGEAILASASEMNTLDEESNEEDVPIGLRRGRDRENIPIFLQLQKRYKKAGRTKVPKRSV